MTWLLYMIKDNSVYLKHILESIIHIEQFLEEIDHNEAIGEAANQLNKTFLTQHPDIPWENIIGMRHKLIHDYFEIKMELVWDTITIDLPRLKPQLESLIQ